MQTDSALISAADSARELPVALGKASPPIAVVGASVAGVSLQDWVFALTGFYLVLQTAYLVWKWRRDIVKAAREDGRDG